MSDLARPSQHSSRARQQRGVDFSPLGPDLKSGLRKAAEATCGSSPRNGRKRRSMYRSPVADCATQCHLSPVMKSSIVVFIAVLAAFPASAAQDGYPPGLFEHSPVVPGPNDPPDSQGPAVGLKRSAGGRRPPLMGTARLTSFAPASPPGPSIVLPRSDARMPSAIKETSRPISEPGLRDNPPAEREQVADKTAAQARLNIRHVAQAGKLYSLAVDRFPGHADVSRPLRGRFSRT